MPVKPVLATANEHPALGFHPLTGDIARAPDLAEFVGLPPAEDGRRASPNKSVDNSSAAAAFDRRVRRILEHDACNAFSAVCAERGRQQLALLESFLQRNETPPPLAGIVVGHKDIFLTRDVRTAAGSRVLEGFVPRSDATVVRRLADAGTICIGKLNTHEFATGVTGTVSAQGPTLNPWNHQRVAGGSSCGSAAAVASELVELATGSDTGGSIRIPAACCGVTGFKPTYGRVSTHGVIPFSWSLDHVGPIGRRVAEVSAAFEVLDEHQEDNSAADRPITARVSQGPAALAALRFAVPEALLALADPAVASAVREATSSLEHLGAHRVPIAMPPMLEHAAQIALATFLAEGGAYHAATLATHAHLYQPATRDLLNSAEHVTASEYVRAQRLRARLCREFASFFAHVDVLVCPTLPTIAPPTDESQVQLPGGALDVRAALTTYTRPYNLTGLPALTVPCGFDQGMPIGLQIVGAAFADRTVLDVGQAYEAATDWVRRPPKLPPADAATDR